MAILFCFYKTAEKVYNADTYAITQEWLNYVGMNVRKGHLPV